MIVNVSGAEWHLTQNQICRSKLLSKAPCHDNRIYVEGDPRLFCCVEAYLRDQSMDFADISVMRSQLSYYGITPGEAVCSEFAAIVDDEKRFYEGEKLNLLVPLLDLDDTHSNITNLTQLLSDHDTPYSERSQMKFNIYDPLDSRSVVQSSLFELKGLISNNSFNLKQLRDVSRTFSMFHESWANESRKFVVRGLISTLTTMIDKACATSPSTQPQSRPVIDFHSNESIAAMKQLAQSIEEQVERTLQPDIILERAVNYTKRLEQYHSILGPHKNHFCIAGSSVLNAILGTPSADVDYFCLTKDDDILHATLKYVCENNPTALVSVSCKAISLKLECGLKLQIVLHSHESVQEVLCKFDVDACCFAYFNRQVQCTRRAQYAVKHMLNHVDIDFADGAYEHRLKKYAERGFSIFLPHFDRRMATKVDSELRGFCKLNSGKVASRMEGIRSGYNEHNGTNGNASHIQSWKYFPAVSAVWMYIDSLSHSSLRTVTETPLTVPDESVEVDSASDDSASDEESVSKVDSSRPTNNIQKYMKWNVTRLRRLETGLDACRESTHSFSSKLRVVMSRLTDIFESKESAIEMPSTLRMTLDYMRYMPMAMLDTLNTALCWTENDITNNVTQIVSNHRTSYLHLGKADTALVYMMDMSKLFVNPELVTSIPRTISLEGDHNIYRNRYRSQGRYADGIEGLIQWYGEAYTLTSID